MVPREIFFTSGVGKHRHKLQSFELALREAGIEICNLVTVSSIFPPGCKIIPKARGVTRLKPGQITYCVMARCETDEPNRLVTSAVGLAVPANGEHYGYISEYHGYGMKKQAASDLVEDMAATMLATTLGVEFDPDTAYDQRKETYRMSGKIIASRSEVQTAEGDKNGLWTTVVSAAVFCTLE
ncbi:MAG: arginine decarboxylase, pyruvoyl-dependent [Planctomycetes bacterium GWC2_49_10]|nr:MAG: arginine decarboxylase, pyruvoyl-dependent [Planctomycetes bacterium GWC2_49_10]